MSKPYSQACENNKAPILAVLKTIWSDPCEILEIGGGTGQHAVYFSQYLPQLSWQVSDQTEYLPGIQSWLDEYPRTNLKAAIQLDINDQPWPLTRLQGVFTANTLHIISWEEVETLFQRLGDYLLPEAKFICYGPFNKQGQFTSDSNERFEQWLKDRDPKSGIRDIDDLKKLAAQQAIILIDEIEMPANNKILIWQKSN